MKIPEVARLLGKPEKTIRYWIRHGKLPARLVKGQYEIEASDLPVIPEEAPGNDVVMLRETLEHTVETLERLSQRIEALEQAQSSSVRTLRPAPGLYTVSHGETVSARGFAEKHKVSRDRMETLIKSGQVETTTTPYQGTVQHRLNQEQQRAVIVYWQEHNVAFTACPACPH